MNRQMKQTMNLFNILRVTCMYVYVCTRTPFKKVLAADKKKL